MKDQADLWVFQITFSCLWGLIKTGMLTKAEGRPTRTQKMIGNHGRIQIALRADRS